MLGKLFGSKARVKILKLFLLNPGKKYYIREMARDLKLQPNSVRRELENLEKFGLLTSAVAEGEIKDEDNGEASQNNKKTGRKTDEPSKTDKKYFRVNADFVLFEEIKALIMKAQILYEKDFIEKLQKTGYLKLLILTGFFVNLPGVPVDLFIVGRLHRPGLLKVIKEMEGELGREINYTIMDTKEFRYRRDITDVFLYSILEAKKIVVIDELDVVN
ncbi:hypothetical protein A2303_02935 [Candidatus Falkowbacteria bacterium RIFOXYB2_FULL_47_14]|uniref:HTH arsR-type domain-containing protein n=1 Tax=Candidatus Falkowbacteria bacterium RIFOXYA2_FULL_47_19 TaxID=1797994 RepID=A0A1F5SLL9_9BACT|nr:MAG: hypothetical protein A2227_02010 [Candidatus Falkowbacteria bacterium RIFOXYA2_FULL_47_19]OGF36271.1 MAG: hypothetical protein A2468_07680 [Candidatus Falkowbacteria bacterium RIFOXYC2_FULL_46_15]OGF43075.1 MAG: hypothetical protein A2303_02935 [Candidatus Falkowbacteria bacterium RIFOXYB2_FULL_47_14]